MQVVSVWLIILANRTEKQRGSEQQMEYRSEGGRTCKRRTKKSHKEEEKKKTKGRKEDKKNKEPKQQPKLYLETTLFIT